MKNNFPYAGYMKHPVLGLIEVTASDEAVKTLSFVTSERSDNYNENDIIRKAITELDEYFAGQRTTFSVPVEPEGTEFQKKVWAELIKIPFATTVSYLDIAIKLKNTGAIRAVGSANGRNPVAIIVPCHRVIGSNGKLTGYAGGLWRKEWLLEHEKDNDPYAEQPGLFSKNRSEV